jgi:hypothetical protein
MTEWQLIKRELKKCRLRLKQAIAGNRPQPLSTPSTPPVRSPRRKHDASRDHRPTESRETERGPGDTDLTRLARLQLAASRQGAFLQSHPAKENEPSAFVREFQFARSSRAASRGQFVQVKESPPQSGDQVEQSAELLVQEEAKQDEDKLVKLSREQRAMLLPFALDLIDQEVRRTSVPQV